MTLTDYETGVADLLHDPQFRIWSQAQVDLYINEARRQVATDTGCMRVLQTAWLSNSQESYTFGQVTGAAIISPGSGYVSPQVSFAGGGGTGVAASLTQSGGAVNAINFSAFGGGYTSAPTATVTDAAGPGTGAVVQTGVINVSTYDIKGVAVVWGAERYSLLFRPFSEFSARLRLWLASQYQTQPMMWSTYGQTRVFVGPPPDQGYPVEFDSTIMPTPLTGTQLDTEIPPLMQDPVKFYAAHLAKFNGQAYGEAEMLRSAYVQRMKEVNGAWDFRLRDPYSS